MKAINWLIIIGIATAVYPAMKALDWLFEGGSWRSFLPLAAWGGVILFATQAPRAYPSIMKHLPPGYSRAGLMVFFAGLALPVVFYVVLVLNWLASGTPNSR